MDMLMAAVMDDVIDIVVGAVGSALFGLIVPTMSLLITTIGNIFKAFAGMRSDYKVDKPEGALDTDGGLVYDLLNTPLIKRLIISIMILAGFLLIIFTVMAFLKNVYAQKQKTAKDIISNTLKGALYFIFVPVCTLLGVYLGNIVLKAVDGVTSPTGSSGDLGRRLFVNCAYNANYFRNGTNNGHLVGDLQELANFWGYYRADEITEGLTDEEYAFFVDDMYATTTIPIEGFGVARMYHISQFDFLTYIIGGCFMLYVLASLAFAMVRRIFIMLIWFVISPACCAMFPLDEGKMVGKYKDEMTKQVLTAYGAVAGVNLFYSIMPLIEQIDFYGGNIFAADLMGIIELFILVSGLLCVKEVVSSLSSLIGGEDALSKGSSLMKASTGAMKKYGGGAVKGVSKFTGEVAARYAYMRRVGDDGKPVHGRGASFWGALGTSVGLGAGFGAMKGLLGVDVQDIKKAYGDSKKAKEDELGAKEAKKAVKDFTKALEEGKEEIVKGIKSWNDVFKDGADSMSKFIKEFTLRGGSKEDAIKMLSAQSANPKYHRGGALDVLTINRELAKYESDKSKLDVAASQNLPGLNAAQARFEAAESKWNAEREQMRSFNTMVSYDSNGVRTMNASQQAYNEALGKALSGDFSGALEGLSKVDRSNLTAHERDQLIATEQQIKGFTGESEMKSALSELEHLAHAAATGLENVGLTSNSSKTEGANYDKIEKAASAIANLSNNLVSAGGKIEDIMKSLKDGLTKVKTERI